MTKAMEALSIPGRTTSVGLTLPTGLSYEGWLAVVAKLKLVTRASMWWWGDALNYGERNWGEKYEQALSESDYDYQTLRNAKWIAARFELSARADKLSFKHHEVVASLDPKVRERLLVQAEKDGLSVQELRRAVQRLKASFRASELPDNTYRIVYFGCALEIQRQTGRGLRRCRAPLYDAVDRGIVRASDTADGCARRGVVRLGDRAVAGGAVPCDHGLGIRLSDSLRLGQGPAQHGPLHKRAPRNVTFRLCRDALSVGRLTGGAVRVDSVPRHSGMLTFSAGPPAPLIGSLEITPVFSSKRQGRPALARLR